MRSFIAIFLSAMMATSAVAQQQTPASPPDNAQQQQTLAQAIAECSNEPGSARPPCNVSKDEAKQAKKLFQRGLEARKKKDLRNTFESFREAARLNPANAEYITAREVAKQQLMYELLQRANDDLGNGRQVEAMASIRYAMEVDPTNTFAQEQMLAMLPEIQRTHLLVEDKLGAAAEIHAEPKEVKRSFKYRGTGRQLLEQIVAAYGLTAYFDDSVQNRPVRMEVQDVDFATAMSIATRLTNTFWTPLSPDRLLFAAENEQNRRALERTALRTFYVADASTPQQINDVVNVMRVLFDVRYVTQQASNASITVRAASPVLDAIGAWLESLGEGRPEVSLDIEAFNISHTYARQIGVSVPQTFNLFNVPTEAKKLLGNQSVQDIINQLIASGAINQANTTAIAGLVAQFLAQQGTGSTLLSSPFALFGGGITLMGLSLPGASLRFSAQQSDIQSLQHLTLRAAQGNPAVMKIGDRFPILNSSYAPIFNTAAISQVLQNQTYQAPFPSFTYEDLGVNLKATPQIHRDTDVTLDLELQFRVLGTQSVNGVPIISNREFKGAITLKNGEPAVLAGMITRSDQSTHSGYPFIGRVPVLGLAASEREKNTEDSELLIVITPHITRMVDAKGPLQMTMPATGQR